MIAVLTTLFLSLLCSYHIAFIWPPRFWIKSVRRQISLATLRQANGPSQPYHLGGMQWWWLMVVRMCDNRLNIIIDDKNKRPRGRPRARWIYNITNDERRRKTRRSKVSRGGCQILTRSVNLKLLMIMMMHILKRETAKIKRWTNRTDNFLNSPRLLFFSNVVYECYSNDSVKTFRFIWELWYDLCVVSSIWSNPIYFLLKICNKYENLFRF